MRPTEQAPVTPCPSQQCYANGMCTDCWPHSPIPGMYRGISLAVAAVNNFFSISINCFSSVKCFLQT